MFFTQQANGVLALLHLLGHHPTDGHKALCDVAAGFHKAFFCYLPAKKARMKNVPEKVPFKNNTLEFD